jgi:hypothetical protein
VCVSPGSHRSQSIQYFTGKLGEGLPGTSRHTNIPAFDMSSSITATAHEIHERQVGDMVIFMIIKDILGFQGKLRF